MTSTSDPDRGIPAPLRVGILGYGNRALLARLVDDHPDAVVSAVGDPDPGALDRAPILVVDKARDALRRLQLDLDRRLPGKIHLHLAACMARGGHLDEVLALLEGLECEHADTQDAGLPGSLRRTVGLWRRTGRRDRRRCGSIEHRTVLAGDPERKR